jgi:hypothetical protein
MLLRMLRIIIIVCMIFMLGSCTQQDAEFIGWMSGYMLGTPVAVDGSGTSLKLIVRFAGSGYLVQGALIQVSGNNNDIFRQVKTNSQGEIMIRDLKPGVYTIKAWKGDKYAFDEIYIKGPVIALMQI